MRITDCPFCKEKLHVKKVECLKCGINFEGDFYTSPFMSLTEAQQTFVELFILSSGSLKEMANLMDVTYPTVRARLDEIINDLQAAMKQREGYKEDILDKVDKGKLDPEKAARIIENL